MKNLKTSIRHISSKLRNLFSLRKRSLRYRRPKASRRYINSVKNLKLKKKKSGSIFSRLGRKSGDKTKIKKPNRVMEWFNGMSNFQLGLTIILFQFVLFYVVNIYLSAPVQASTNNVMTLINHWNAKVTATSAMTIGFLYHRIYVNAFDKYQKKLQGKLGQ